MKIALRASPEEIKAAAKRYSYRDDKPVSELAPIVNRRGCLTLDALRVIAHWKSPRSVRHVEANSPAFVEEASRFALNAAEEESRIQGLRMISGVDWPTASVILHFFHDDPYPILDFRALWTLGLDSQSAYHLDFWIQYTTNQRELAIKLGLDMRTLDRGLWEYSKRNQSRRGASESKGAGASRSLENN